MTTLSDLSNEIEMAGFMFTRAGGLLKCSCGLQLSVAALNREDAVDFWYTYAPLIKAAHKVHHSQHWSWWKSGVDASLILVTGDAVDPACYCSDDPAAPQPDER